MENKASLILKVFAAIVSIVAIILVGIAGTSDSPEVGGMIYLTEVLFYLAVIAAIVFPVVIILKDPKRGVTFLIGLVAMLVIYGISYAMAEDQMENGEIVAGSKQAEAGIITFYILFFIAVATVLVGSAKKLIK